MIESAENTLDLLASYIYEALNKPHIKEKVNITDLAWAIAASLWDAGYRLAEDLD